MKQLSYTLMCITMWVTCASSQVAVIANLSVPLAKIEKSDLLDLYTGDMSLWTDGKAIVICDLKQKGEVRDSFYSYLGKSPHRIKSIWLKRMLSGDADPPTFLDSEEEMLKKVASTPGAIGFVSLSKIDEDVKTLLVIGQ